MSFELSFSPEFFLAEGEPYDTDRGVSNRPDSVWQAIVSLRANDPGAWEDMAVNLFSVPATLLTEESVLDMVIETNTCSNLDSPVRVWVDRAGEYDLEVHEASP